MRVCVVGGGSYVGRQTVKLLSPIVEHVRALDVAFRVNHQYGNEERVIVDITEYRRVRDALKDADVCVHVASYGMSGAEQLNKARVHAVNVNGTSNVIKACRECNVRALVYISTYNVVFNGTPFEEGDEEALDYIPDDQHTDEYSRTKGQAERLVLAANCDTLRTCALRPAAIYGDGEYRHLPRIIRLVNKGLGFMAIGRRDVLCDWVYGENLAHAIALAVQRLTADDSAPTVSGRALFISDQQPVNNFTFLATILGDTSLFSVYVPTPAMLALAHVIERAHAIIAPIVPFEPFLTVAEVCKVGVTHYASPRLARHALGYTPRVTQDEAIQRTRAWCEQQVAPAWQRSLVLRGTIAAAVGYIAFALARRSWRACL
ncbi:hypothetical protein PTSG_01854 [Salpingoeca rosetta]|uniref:3-beta hydroxysteroid dehydrogenase/isomerase domain-containing protein n=1 Tax=Salpingoeca rosetta (strain ATCC 50818 / BSB-021) TaxID=946362 RepID=F2TZ53_SALR5|nr:uncharacterized protein PTSG_01854 [Salpingoeca rosetta]EGD78877.1 hypothetical protein PTSG_01854 [Salpingoeca rosetta]|eukprot:XP_004997833.1 hypothetical protein PTSG_01854 [Salpingoeca rosetta]